jgi:hypothetical protein
LNDFFNQKSLRNMVSQRDNKLNFADIMDSGKIFLAKLSEGLGGEKNSYLLGTLLIAKFQQLTMARQSQKIEDRPDFWLYIDEFQHFISPSMTKILTGARKYRLGFTLSHQHLHQLQGDGEVASAVMTEPYTRIVLRVGDDDAKKLSEGFESFDDSSLKTLEKFHAIARVERNDFDFNLALRKPDLSEYSDERKEAVIAASRVKYATPRAEVEAALLASIRGGDKKSEPPAPKPASPPPVTPHVAEAVVPLPIIEKPVPAVTEIPKSVETPKTAMIPATEIPNVTGSEKKTQPVVAAQVTTAEPKDLGRGGARHKAIQSRLKTEAQKLGFHAEVEKQLAQGSNDAADLVLRRGQVEIAVEITITTGVDHEFENVKKCLAAGFNRVAMVATGRKQLEAIAAAVQGGLGPDAALKVGYHTPDEFLAELQKLAKATELPPPSEPMAKTGKILGFEITRNFPKQTPEEQRLNQQAIHEVTMKAMKT